MIKRILTIGVVGLALMSCNNDKKTEQKANPETGKLENVAEEAKPAPKAISDSAGVYTQKFILEVGKTYPFSSTQKEKTTLKDHTGQSMSGTQDVVDERNVVVDSFENGVYTLTITTLGKKMTSVADGKTIVIDTKQAAPKDEQLKGLWTINNAQIGNKLTVKLKENGEVVSVTGFDTIYKKMEKAISSLIPEKDAKKKKAEMLKKAMDNFKQNELNESLFKAEFEKGINILPKKGVKIGESWTESENLDPQGKVKSSVTFTLAKIENGVAEITIKGSVPKTSDKQTQEGITMTMSIEGNQHGTLKVDENTGWIISSKINNKTTSKQTMTNGKETQSVIQTSEATITVN